MVSERMKDSLLGSEDIAFCIQGQESWCVSDDEMQDQSRSQPDMDHRHF
jgi:hypothetical protein